MKCFLKSKHKLIYMILLLFLIAVGMGVISHLFDPYKSTRNFFEGIILSIIGTFIGSFISLSVVSKNDFLKLNGNAVIISLLTGLLFIFLFRAFKKE